MLINGICLILVCSLVIFWCNCFFLSSCVGLLWLMVFSFVFSVCSLWCFFVVIVVWCVREFCSECIMLILVGMLFEVKLVWWVLYLLSWWCWFFFRLGSVKFLKSRFRYLFFEIWKINLFWFLLFWLVWFWLLLELLLLLFCGCLMWLFWIKWLLFGWMWWCRLLCFWWNIGLLILLVGIEMDFLLLILVIECLLIVLEIDCLICVL